MADLEDTAREIVRFPILKHGLNKDVMIEEFVDTKIDEMSNVELLELISRAHDRLTGEAR